MGSKVAKAARSTLSGPPPPTTQSISDSTEVTDVLGDARVLTDFTAYLVEKKLYLDLGYLRHLELFQDDYETREMCIDNLESSWQAYRKDPSGMGNFQDVREWAHHDLPHEDVLQKISFKAEAHSENEVGEEHPNYILALASAVGIHVATVCSSIIDEPRGDPDTWPVEIQDALKYCARRYKVPAEGSAYSPNLITDEGFEIEEFAPTIFSSLRTLAGISPADYMESLCRTDFRFIQFGSNSKSGEIFFFSHDMAYLLKTAADDEARILLDMCSDMKKRFQEEPRSLLGRYLGLYRLTIAGKAPKCFLIMRAISTIPVNIQHKYDLKGSTRNRKAKPEESIGKDINFRENVGTLGLAPDVAEALADIHSGDCELLAKHEIMDYSVLVEMYYPNRKGTGEIQQHPSHSFKVNVMPQASGSEWWRKQKIMQTLDVNAPVPIEPRDIHPDKGIPSADNKVVYFMGVIDCLVAYEVYPKVQYAGMNCVTGCKGDLSSRVPPDMYAERQIQMFHEVCGIPIVFVDEE